MGLVRIRAEEYAPKEEYTGKKMSIELSPYDIPREVKGELDRQSGIFHIYFQYPDKEESVTNDLNEKLSIKVGKYSGKILGFEVKVVKYDINELVLIIVSAVDQQIPKIKRFNELENYKLIRSVVKREQKPIFSDLTA